MSGKLGLAMVTTGVAGVGPLITMVITVHLLSLTMDGLVLSQT